jgi:hypothetical protein
MAHLGKSVDEFADHEIPAEIDLQRKEVERRREKLNKSTTRGWGNSGSPAYHSWKEAEARLSALEAEAEQRGL